MKFIESFCMALGAIGFLVFGSAFVTGSHYNFEPAVLILVLAGCAGFAAWRVHAQKEDPPSAPHRPARAGLIVFAGVMAVGLVVIGVLTDHSAKYWQTTIVFDRAARDKTHLMEAFLTLHEYLTANGFTPSAEPDSSTVIRAGIISARMVSFSYLSPAGRRGSFRLRVEVLPKELHLTCYAVPFGPRKGSFDESVKSSEDFARELQETHPQFFRREMNEDPPTPGM